MSYSHRRGCFGILLAVVACLSVMISRECNAREKGRLDVLSHIFQGVKAAPSCELTVKEKYEYYDIEGVTIDELRRQMKENGTKWDDGKVYAALTTWDIRYNYDVSSEDGICCVKSAKTSVEIVYHLPRRVASPTEPAYLSDVWDRYLEHLKAHEFGHKALAVKTAGEINETLAALDRFTTKYELAKRAESLISAKLQKLNEVQVQYDHETRHGATQGAVLQLDSSKKL